LDFTRLSGLHFEPADMKRYPGLQLAWDTLRGPEGSTAVLNAANEIAVAAFLAGTIRFDQIHSVNARTLDAVSPAADACCSVDGLLSLDAQARRAAEGLLMRMRAP
ncbi:MAG TPA: 1-deoxy-D-xylulose-5-phosphate reductoisomerase, partial [Rhizobacter sp.]|nr:1-deoxy-D-xylulose-5-phosphate reductoisomerase [Rhizobacter sp.]